MASISTTLSVIKKITSRDITLLQKFYRSREFNNNILISENIKNTYTFIIYGAMNTLSSRQRSQFRTYVNQSNSFKNIKIQLTLFSSTVAKSLMGFSSLSKLDTQFKGTTYQRTVTISNEKEHEANKEIIDFFNYLTKLKFTEDVSFTFAPSIIFVLSSKGKLISSHRFMEYEAIVKKEIYSKGQSIPYLISIIESVRNINI